MLRLSEKHQNGGCFLEDSRMEMEDKREGDFGGDGMFYVLTGVLVRIQ